MTRLRVVAAFIFILVAFPKLGGTQQFPYGPTPSGRVPFDEGMYFKRVDTNTLELYVCGVLAETWTCGNAFLLQQNGDFLLQQNGDKIILSQ